MQYRCKSCGKLLAVGSGTVQIKYHRFSGYNIVSLDAKMDKGIEYQDNMIYKID